MLIQNLIVNRQLELVTSFVVYEEVLAISNASKRNLIVRFLDNASIYVAKDKFEEVLALATQIMETGVKYMDAAHTACSIVAQCDYMITTDKRLLKFKSDIITIINPIDFIRIWEDRANA